MDTTTFGKYQLTALLGSGGMGEVYEALDTEKDRTVAVKILREQYADDENFRARFLREAHAAANLQEPHIVPIHDWGEIDGRLYLDMRLVRGHTLHELLADGPVAPHRAVAIIEQVAAALDAAHTEGVVHRDIKPQNIIVTATDFAYLVDFGIAQAQGDSGLTQEGMQIGTFSYMAPERFGDAPCTAAADTYALACVLFEMLSGEAPFRTESVEQLIAAHLTTPPPRPSAAAAGVPSALDTVIARGMAKEPDDRYGSAGAFARAARRAVAPSTQEVAASAETMLAPAVSPPVFTAPPLAPAEPEPARPSMVPLAVIGTVAAVLLGVVGLVTGLLMSKDPAPQPSSMPTTATSVPPQTVFASPSTVYRTVSAPPATRTTTSLAAPDPEVTSALQLRQLAREDFTIVSTQGADLWVPQLASKRPGVVDEGHTWDNALTLAEHLRLRQRYGAKLLWSGDWSTFSAPDFWVTIAPITYASASGALAWCAYQGFDRDHCYAKLISRTHGVKGSTAFN